MKLKSYFILASMCLGSFSALAEFRPVPYMISSQVETHGNSISLKVFYPAGGCGQYKTKVALSLVPTNYKDVITFQASILHEDDGLCRMGYDVTFETDLHDQITEALKSLEGKIPAKKYLDVTVIAPTQGAGTYFNTQS